MKKTSHRIAGLEKTIRNIRALLTDKNCSRMNKANLVGYLGELLILQTLKKEGCEVIHQGNQSRVDLVWEGCHIDVKTSTSKNEDYKQGKPYWGWALIQKTKNQRITSTHLICVGLDSNFLPTSYFVIKKENLKFFPGAVGQFKNVKRGLRLPCTPQPINCMISPNIRSKKRKKLEKFYRDCQKLLRSKKIIRVIDNSKLSNYLYK